MVQLQLFVPYTTHSIGLPSIEDNIHFLLILVIGSPIDVLKTRYMNARPGQYRGIHHTLTDLISEAGLQGFYKGFTPNVLRIGTFNMLVFVFYEQILWELRLRSGDLKNRNIQRFRSTKPSF